MSFLSLIQRCQSTEEVDTMQTLFSSLLILYDYVCQGCYVFARICFPVHRTSLKDVDEFDDFGGVRCVTSNS